MSQNNFDFDARARRQIEGMLDILDHKAPKLLFAQRLVTLTSICWAFIGDSMCTAVADQEIEYGRRRCRLCLDCGKHLPHEWVEEICENCEISYRSIDAIADEVLKKEQNEGGDI